ncbi:hypothetical protein Sru01_06680 [Sphaerisporangium rufum]|uniref:HIRAN domain-containing protein n=1 Tax=Sphaerisporangium rufum TaxID=1381558 RepID=A0A919UW50_9ACTN|nr:hypothetical protein [Sphaerisporangium rufum]GII75686.1 hypothetical protein Sru01_06680 [Sphaerisporangium rufum]
MPSTPRRAGSARAADTVAAPRLLVAWQDPQTHLILPVGILEQSPHGFSFSYLRRARDIAGFRPLFGFDRLEDRYESPGLFPLFRQRLMDSRRTDYLRYLTALGLSENASPLAVLGRSEGRRAGDSIFLMAEPEVDDKGRTHADFFVHGIRYKADAESQIATLRVGEPLRLRDDPDNPVNSRALLVTHRGDELGWVPNLLLNYVHIVRDTDDVAIFVAQVNGNDVPPNLRLRVELTGTVPVGYRPFHGEEWATIA